ncbi:actin interacting protein 1 [Scheffersomyces coipomensis]|uniref:actin interacting protein 1 n=1 Tax=Scheffersomyces coipomensis TaxID=1788519 RepID=UPI00315D7DA6
MSIKPIELFPPQPTTVRANSVHLSYDSVHDRLVYPNGKSIVVRAVDPNSSQPVLQFTKHIHLTTAASFSPSGNYVASGDESGQVKIWEAINYDDGTEELKIKSEFQILSGPIKSIAWDADGNRVIAVGQGKEKFGHCFTWDSGNSIGEIQGHSGTIYDVDIKPQRPYRAATVSEDKALVFFTGPPFKFDKSIRGHHTNSVRSVKFSPDGKWLISVGSDRTIAVYDGKTGEFIKKLDNAHDGGIYSISWFKDSSKFVTASADNKLKVWDAESLEVQSELGFGTTSTVVKNQQVGVVVTKEFIISLSFSGHLNYFKFDEVTPFLVVPGHQSPLTALIFANNTLITGGSDGSIYQWNKSSDDSLNKLSSSLGDGHSNYVVDILSTGSQILSIGWDDKLRLWNSSEEVSNVTLSEQPKGLKRIKDKFLVLFEKKIELYSSDLIRISEYTLGFSASDFDILDDQQVLITDSNTNSLKEYVLEGDNFKLSSKSYASLRSPPTITRVSPNGKYVAVADATGKYTLYDTSNASVITTRWAFHSSRVFDSKWTPDSQFVISGGLDTGLFLYSVAKPSKVLKFPLAHQIGISGLEWLKYDSENKYGKFASIGLDGSIKLWDVDFSVYFT